MNPLDILHSKVVDRLQDILDDIEHDFTLENPEGNKWKLSFSFDLDKEEYMSDADKEFLTALLKKL